MIEGVKEWLHQHKIMYYPMGGDKWIFYSPIARRYAVASVDQLQNFISHGKYPDVFGRLIDYVPIHQQTKVRSPQDYTLLTVLPNNVCNFTCSYCYSAHGRGTSRLEWDQLKVAIDFFMDSKPQGFNRQLTISYMGGGEPMLSWEVVKKGIIYAERRAGERGLKLQYRIITNGSILNDEILEFLSEHQVAVSVSFEVLPEIQDKQRGSFSLVSAHILRLIQRGIDVQINSTITPDNVARMTEMINVLHDNYPQVKNVMFEPVTGQELFSSTLEMRQFYDTYVDQFLSCLRLADTFGLALTSFAYLRTIFPLERACPGELCITADGYFTGCYCVSSPKERLFSQTCYGRVDHDNVVFDMERYQALKAHDVYERGECQDCEVKWNCGGGCYYQFASYSDSYRSEVCRFTKLFVETLVRYKVEYRLSHKMAGDEPILLNE